MLYTASHDPRRELASAAVLLLLLLLSPLLLLVGFARLLRVLALFFQQALRPLRPLDVGQLLTLGDGSPPRVVNVLVHFARRKGALGQRLLLRQLTLALSILLRELVPPSAQLVAVPLPKPPRHHLEHDAVPNTVHPPETPMLGRQALQNNIMARGPSARPRVLRPTMRRRVAPGRARRVCMRIRHRQSMA